MKIQTSDIILDPNPILRKKADEVAFPLKKKDKEIALGLLDYVERSRDPELVEKENLKPASGLAAPQIGVSKRMFAVIVDYLDDDENLSEYRFALVNPKIISYSVKQIALSQGEGCLSIEEVYEGYVYRSAKIKIRGYDVLQEKDIEITASGYLAIVLQHEYDHVNGVLFYDHINQENPWAEKENSLILE